MNSKAIDAAADALRDAFDRGVGGFDEQARIALEAAAPYMLAAAWDEGQYAWESELLGRGPGMNPYYRETE